VSNNTWSGTNTFNNNIIVNSVSLTPTELSRISGLTSNAQNQINTINSSLSNYTGKNNYFVSLSSDGSDEVKKMSQKFLGFGVFVSFYFLFTEKIIGAFHGLIFSF
jgi:hypothetical protein